MSAITDFINSAPDPRQDDYKAHIGIVRKFDSTLREYAINTLDSSYFSEQLRHQIARLGGDAEKAIMAEVCVGSDGREEKGVSSPMDLVVYVVGSGLARETCRELGEMVNASFPQFEGQRIFETVEAKFLEGRVSLFNGSLDGLWPDRVLDSFPLREENQDVVQAARLKLLSELRDVDQGAFGKKLIKRIGERLTHYRSITRAGKQTVQGNDVEHFNIDKGEAYYDQELNRTALGPSSFKQSLLRLIQNTINREVLHHLRELDSVAARDFLLKLPTNTEARIRYLDQEGVFNRDKLNHAASEKLIDNYLYFLWLYHQSEYCYLHHANKVIAFDRTLVKERREDVLDLSLRAVKRR